MLSRLIQSHLDTIETRIRQVSRCLLDPSADGLVQASADLQIAVIELSRLPQLSGLDRHVTTSLKLRMRQMMASFDACREALLRRSFLTESSLSTLIPATRNSTYAPAAGGYTRQPYGSAGRRSGEFQVISA
jgi:hypothetical protein